MESVEINNIPELKQNHVHIKNLQELQDKINKMIVDGSKKLQIITDFDFTLTKRTKPNGEDVMTSFSILWECPSIDQKYRDLDKELGAKYRPYERDNNLTREEKVRYMVEWYTAVNENLRGVKLPREELLEVGRSMVQYFRDGVQQLMSWTQRHEVPVLVSSAGQGDAVRAVLAAGDFLLPNVQVMSNFVALDKEGKIIGIDGSIMHTMNKDETVVRGSPHHARVKERRNVVLMGDSLGDTVMADGVDHDLIIKIGFLQDAIDVNLPKYLAVFDIVLVRDPTMDVVNAILNLVK